MSFILPIPDAENPVMVPAVQEAVHEKVDPIMFEVRIIFVFDPEQIDLDKGAFVIWGTGLTVMI